MKYILNIGIIFILRTCVVIGQDFEFVWQIWPSFSQAYTVRINQQNNKRTIMVKETIETDSVVKRLKKVDVDTLVSFLDTYDYPIKGSTIYGPIKKEFHETVILPDTNWLIVNGDSTRKEIMWVHGYEFDIDSNKAYTEWRMMSSWTDGTTYKGYYKSVDVFRKFSVYCARLSIIDYSLYSFILRLITRYDKENNYSSIKQDLAVHKPENE